MASSIVTIAGLVLVAAWIVYLWRDTAKYAPPGDQLLKRRDVWIVATLVLGLFTVPAYFIARRKWTKITTAADHG